MCYKIVTHFNHCSHRTSTINLCPRSTQHLPTIYHPPRPCVTNSHEHDLFVCRDQLCDACSSAHFWSGCWPNRGTRRDTRRDDAGARKNKQDKSLSGRVTEDSSYYHHSPPGQRISAWRQGVTAESLDPIPTQAAQEDMCPCPLSEAFERAVRIEDDVGGPASTDDLFHEEEWSGEVGEDDGVDYVRTRERKGEYGPLRPPHPPSYDSGKRSAGSPFQLGGHGGYSRRTRRRTGGNKKRVRFARKVEMVCFRGDSATSALGSLGREYKACR